MPKFSARAITAAYIVALAIIGLLTVASSQILRAAISKHEGLAAAVNESGRQRMRSQRLASLVAQHALGSTEAAERIHQTADKMEAAHNDLVSSSQSARLSNTTRNKLATIYEAPARLDALVRDYIARARAITATPPGASAEARQTEQIFATANDELLDKLNEVVNIYEHEVEMQLSLLLKKEGLAMSIIIIALILEAVFIFRPLIRRITMSLDTLFESLTVGVASVGLNGQVRECNSRFRTLMAHAGDRTEHPHFDACLFPEDRNKDHELRQKLIQGKRDSYTIEQRIPDAEGEPKWHEMTYSITRDQNNLADQFVVIVRDVSEQKRLEVLRDMLVGELHHRLKNTLTVIQGVVNQTLSMTKDPKAFATAIRSRIQSIAKAHDMLTAAEWRAIKMRQIICENLDGPFRQFSNRISVVGTDVRLPGEASLIFNLLTFELLTNAVKHGALSTPKGRIEIMIEECDRDGEPFVRVLWLEKDSHRPKANISKGFGSFLLERGVKFSLNGESTMESRDDGLKITFAFPLSEQKPAVQHQISEVVRDMQAA